MKLTEKYKNYKSKYQKYIILIKSGVFYETYDEDAYIMHNLFNFNVKQVGGLDRVGFPLVSYDKVCSKLKSLKINYIIFDGNDYCKNKNVKNCYDNYKSKDLSINKRINRVNERLIRLSNSAKINEILAKIEEII